MFSDAQYQKFTDTLQAILDYGSGENKLSYLSRISLCLHYFDIVKNLKKVYRYIVSPDAYLLWLRIQPTSRNTYGLPVDKIVYTVELARKLNHRYAGILVDPTELELYQKEISRNPGFFDRYYLDPVEGEKVLAVWNIEGDSDFINWARWMAMTTRCSNTAMQRKNKALLTMQQTQSYFARQNADLESLITFHIRATQVVNTSHPVSHRRQHSA
ncbi:hypothetical protein BDP27DRAFT_1414824 [Rhodocollybia butyracea]|uniref:Uncharacterized protein n=1 Tax=Rhodocollybia butyracea TaxID=206335 RepID=A0A9P5UEJ9_9AGAR|nr:hypothetical protein BDP27DRAFT_1414824 [Rhodocollybia butyracea]